MDDLSPIFWSLGRTLFASGYVHYIVHSLGKLTIDWCLLWVHNILQLCHGWALCNIMLTPPNLVLKVEYSGITNIMAAQALAPCTTWSSAYVFYQYWCSIKVLHWLIIFILTNKTYLSIWLRGLMSRSALCLVQYFIPLAAPDSDIQLHVPCFLEWHRCQHGLLWFQWHILSVPINAASGLVQIHIMW